MYYFIEKDPVPSLIPDESESSNAMSSSEISKSNEELMDSLFASFVFGITAAPFCNPHLSKTWALLTLYFFFVWTKIAVFHRSCLHRTNGIEAIICMFFSLWKL